MRSSQNHPNQTSGVYGFILLLFIFCIMMIIHQSANASHMLGAELTYKHLSGQKYQVQYTLYRDCNGISAPANMNLKVQSENCSLTSFHSLELDLTSGKELVNFCSNQTSTCQGGNYLGAQAWKYSCEVIIPANCSDWKFSVTDCCRNAGITTIVNPTSSNIYVEALLNNTLGQNSMGEFVNSPTIQLYLNQTQIINARVNATDGDSLVYTLSTPNTGSETYVDFQSSYSQLRPLGTEMFINAQTGEISLVPNQVLNGVISVLVKEYRNGIHIGSVSRDIEVSVKPSYNIIPTLTGVNGSNENTINICKNAALSFKIYSYDADQGNQVKISWTSDMPEVRVRVGAGTNPTTEVLWNSNIAVKENYTLTVYAQDNACPVNAVQSRTYLIHVSDLNLQIKSQNVSCEGANDAGIQAIVSGGSQPYAFNWSDQNISTSSRKNLSAGTYSVMITDANACSTIQQVIIQEGHSAPIINLGGQLSGCNGMPLKLEAGSGTNLYEWSNNASTSSIEVTTAGNYSVRVTNQYGCSAISNVKVVFQDCAGNDQQQQSRAISTMYPNPVVDKVNLRIENPGEGVISFKILDLRGKIIESHISGNTSLNHSLDLSNLPSGAYILVASTSRDVQSFKFCKQ